MTEEIALALDSFPGEAELAPLWLAAWGEKHDRGLLEIAIGGLAARPGCSSVIAGATKPEQVAANARAGEWVPTDEELAEIDTILAGPAA